MPFPYVHAPWECRSFSTALCTAVFCAVLGVLPAWGQERTATRAASGADTSEAGASSSAGRWRLIVDGQRQPWTARAWALDSLGRVAGTALRHVRAQGYFRAHLDSAVVDTAGDVSHGVLYIDAGPRAEVGRIRVVGNRVLSEHTLLSLMDTRPGHVLRPERLEADLHALLRRYDEEGFPIAQARIARLDLQGGAPAKLLVTIAVDEGASLRLLRVEREGEGRTRTAFIQQVTGLQAGAPLEAYDPAAVRERLRETGLFEHVGQPELFLSGADAEGAVVRVPLEEKPPGAFDLVLGYLPPSEGEGGRLVGSGELVLRSPFGAGRTASVQLDRRPDAVSRFEVEAAHPFILGTPLQLSLAFEGRQEDSTYAQQRYSATSGYRVAHGMRLRLTLSREVTRPGIAGSRLVGGPRGMSHQRVARASSLSGAVGLHLRRLEGPPQNPRRGVYLEADAALGRKRRRARRVSQQGDTVRVEETHVQQQFEGHARLYLSPLPRQVIVFGTDAAVLWADRYDRSDLFFLGGAGSLRGYDEDRFRGHVAGRALGEYRYLLGRRSFAYGFLDLGFVRRPLLPGAAGRSFGVHPGFGMGLQFDSRLGLVDASYALNDEDGLTGGRVHLGLAIGL